MLCIILTIFRKQYYGFSCSKMTTVKKNNSPNCNVRSASFSVMDVVESNDSKQEMATTENATREEKSSRRTLAFSIDKIMSAETKPPSTTSCSVDHRIWRNVRGTTNFVVSGEEDDAMTPDVKVVASQHHRNNPEVVSRTDAVTRYHLQQQKMKIANAVMMHMATGNGVTSEVGGLFSAARHPELLLRQYQRHPYHLPSSVHAERYHQNTTGITSFSVDPVASSFNRCRLPVSSDVTWSPSNRRSLYHSPDKSEFMSESLHSPARSTIWRKRTHYDQRDVTDWSQLAAGIGSLRRHAPSPTGSPQSAISSCSAARDDEEIVVDDDVDARKQFSPTSELPVQRQEAVNDSGDISWTGKTGDVDLERSPGARPNSSTWFVS